MVTILLTKSLILHPMCLSVRYLITDVKVKKCLKQSTYLKDIIECVVVTIRLGQRKTFCNLSLLCGYKSWFRILLFGYLCVRNRLNYGSTANWKCFLNNFVCTKIYSTATEFAPIQASRNTPDTRALISYI